MGKVKLLLDVIGDLRSLADSLQAVADAVAYSDAAGAEMTTTIMPISPHREIMGGRISLTNSSSTA